MKTLLDFGIQIQATSQNNNSYEKTLEKALKNGHLSAKQVQQLKKEHKKHIEYRNKNKFEGKCDKCNNEARFFSSKFRLCYDCYEKLEVEKKKKED